MKTKLCIFLVLFSLTILQFWGCRTDSVETAPRTYTHFCFDTVCQITIYSAYMENESEIAHTCFEICDKYDHLFNKHDKKSEVSKINFQSPDYVDVSKETFDIIRDSKYYSRLSSGSFDITISPIVDLWDINNHPHVPKKKNIAAALKYVNYKNIQLKDSSVKLAKHQEIDLGGIAKGYVADKIKNFLTKKQISSAIINLGGNILVIGDNDKKDFNIGIKKPFSNKNNAYSAKIKIKNKSVVTSGAYERYFKKNNKIYHHILNPKTGYPTDNSLYSVTIISDKSEDGDALSTATFVMGLEKGMSFINHLNHIYAVFITKDYKLHLSDGLIINKNNEISISQ